VVNGPPRRRRFRLFLAGIQGTGARTAPSAAMLAVTAARRRSVGV